MCFPYILPPLIDLTFHLESVDEIRNESNTRFETILEDFWKEKMGTDLAHVGMRNMKRRRRRSRSRPSLSHRCSTLFAEMERSEERAGDSAHVIENKLTSSLFNGDHHLMRKEGQFTYIFAIVANLATGSAHYTWLWKISLLFAIIVSASSLWKNRLPHSDAKVYEEGGRLVW